DTRTTEFKVGSNAAPPRRYGVAPNVNGIDFSSLFISLTGSVANNGIAGQGASSGITSPGGLIRANSAQNGRSQPYDAWALSFIDSLTKIQGNHMLKFGGEFRPLRLTTDRLRGTPHSFSKPTPLLAKPASAHPTP